MTDDTKKQAVALQYDGKEAPEITAKGEGDLAEQIIELAKAHGVHLHEDKQLVTLLASLDLGDRIPKELYITIAEIIAFVYLVNGKVPEGWQRQD